MRKGLKNVKEEKYKIKQQTDYLKNLQKEREAEISRVANERKAAQDERKAVEEEFNKLLENLPALREEARTVLNERNDTISPLVESCKVYHKALTEQYSPLLDERDWQHLDLVIYQLETRRADSVKEALQLVDRELQTERLENSIRAAIKSICFTLQRGFAALQDSININCAKINDSLYAMSTDIIAAMNLNNRQLTDAVKGQLAVLTNSVNVGNALQAKANETSAQLMDDVAALRYYNTDMYV